MMFEQLIGIQFSSHITMKEVLTEPPREKKDDHEDDGQGGPSSHPHTVLMFPFSTTIFSSTHIRSHAWAGPCCGPL